VNGLDKIINEITSEAENAADSAVAEAKKSALAAEKRANEKAEEILKKAELEAETEYKKRIAMAKSSTDAALKRAMLCEKQNVISKIIDEAYNRLISLSDAEYFKCMTKLLEKSCARSGGEIILSSKDKARASAEFIKAAEDKGLKISQAVRDIDGGFILVYNDIEENCSFSAVMEDKRESLNDEVNSFLF
jgi:V/A-type H+-transporting ATPase subunit E